MAAELEPLLRALLEPDTEGLRRATARLREALKDPQAPAVLAALLGASPHPQVRQLAAVLLRRRLLGRWRRLNPELRDRLPSLVAEALETETEHAVTLALAQLGALVLEGGGARGPLGSWVQAAARDPRPPQREAALLVLSAALDVAPPALAPQAPALAELFRGALAFGGPPPTLAYALKALGGLAATVGDTQTELLRSLLPEILRALKLLLDVDEDRGTEALEVLDEFLEADPAAVTPHLGPLLDLCLQVAGDEGRGDAARVRALATITFLAQKSPKALLRGALLPRLLEGLLGPLCADPRPGHPDPEDEEEGGGRGGPCPRHAAAQALDALAVALPPEKLLHHLVPLLGAAWGSPRGGPRKGALLALGALAEGAGGALRQRFLSQVLGALRGGLGDPDPGVRGAAAAALKSLGECLQPEVRTVAEEALPGALAALGGDGGVPPAKAWFILESLLECLGEALGPWVPSVLPPILAALEPSGPPETLELGLSALHSLVSAAGGQVLGGLREAVLGALTPLLVPGPPESRERRLQALGVVGALGAAAGATLGAALDLALDLAQEEEEEEEKGGSSARRAALALVVAVAEALGEGAGPLLPKLLPLVLGTLQRPPPPVEPGGPDSFLLFEEEEEEEAEPMDDDVEEWEELIEVELGGDFAEELGEACEALGALAEHCSSQFLPHVEPSLEALLGVLRLPQPGPHAAAYEALGSLCLLLLSGGPPTPPALERALWALVGGVRGEGGAGDAGAALAALGRGLGPGTPPALRPHIARLLGDVIKGQVRCLKEESEDEEEAQAVAELRVTAGEGLVALGVGEELFEELLPHLLGALAPGRAVGQRSWAAAMLAELGEPLGAALAPLLPRLGPALGGAAARDPHPEVRGNALCALGRLGGAVGQGLGPWWPGPGVALAALAGEGPGRVRDNACGALARHWQHWEHWDSPEALALLLRALPLTEDLEEEPPVFEALVGLHRRRPQQFWPHAAELPRACSDAVAQGRLPPALRQEVLELLREVWGSCPTAFTEGLERLPHGEATPLRTALSDSAGP